MVRPRTIFDSVSKQAHSPLSGLCLIMGQLYSHSWCIVPVHTQLNAQHGQSVDIGGGSYTNFNRSKYVVEDIEVNELDEDNLSTAAGK